MQLGIFSRNREYWSTREIIKAAERKGAKPVYFRTPSVHLRIECDKIDAFYKGKSIRDLSAAIPRIGRSLTSFGILLLHQLELMSIPSTLSLKGLERARNKFLALQALHEHRVSIPPTILLASRIESGDVTAHPPYPLILKLLHGTQGVGVMRVASAEEAGPIIDTLCDMKQLICMQTYLENHGQDIRAFVVGDQVIASMIRKAGPNEWRSNIHRGGTGVAYKLTPAQTEIALRASKAVGVEVAGVDMIEANGETFVIEVNVCPGFQGLLAATGVNAADFIVEHAMHKTKN